MTAAIEIETFDVDRATSHLSGFQEILIDSIEGGGLVGHVVPVDLASIHTYWLEVVSSIEEGGRILICATVDGELAGTVQLYLSPEANAPHRGEVYKLLVHRKSRGRGIGEALMRAVEQEAIKHSRTLLLLDTVQGGVAERLYRRLGWQEIGTVPKHFVDPWGAFRSSVYMMRSLEPSTSG